VQIPREPDERFDAMMNVALYEGAHVVRGLEFLLRTHGTCNTVTAMSQLIQQMSPEERRKSAAMMVRSLYEDLSASVKRHVEQRQPVLNPAASLTELIGSREWLFADGNYHVDVSHLHSIVAFARHLQREDPELRLAIEMARYGSQLSEHLRYPGDVPFDDYYTAHLHFLNALAGDEVDEGLDYFIGRLEHEPDERDRQLIAFVIVDLANRVGQIPRALEAAAPYVSRMEDHSGFSFTSFCIQHGRSDVLEAMARKNDDVLGVATALLTRSAPSSVTT
ncbi:MAG: hypothetical protein KDA96_23890, partial [Planctomycetaceae bacterium]|nr:hypothetical protein [Planctomycetaceae bacterium]